MGSTFSFTARLEKRRGQLSAARDDLAGLHVLIVDDNAANRRILDHHVRSWDMRAGIAEGGEEALQTLRAAHDADDPFNLAILDMNMPGTDGLELAQSILADHRLSSTRLVLLTSSGTRGTAEEALRSGVSAYLSKPVRPSRLHHCLATVMRGGGGETASPTVAAHGISQAKALSGGRVLVAEDNVFNQKVTVAMLEAIGYQADVVASGADAVDAVSRIDYGAVLMDCHMPGMDGFEATVEIRRREGSSRHTPIIAVTAAAIEGDRERCFAAGMDDYLSKPVSLEELDSALERWGR